MAVSTACCEVHASVDGMMWCLRLSHRQDSMFMALPTVLLLLCCCLTSMDNSYGHVGTVC